MTAARSLAVVLLTIAPATGQAPTRPVALEVFGVPLGASLDDMRALIRSRGHPMQVDRSYMEWKGRINELEGTEYVTSIRSWKQTGDRREFFGAFFAAPDNPHRTWSAGMWSEYGTPQAPSTAAPLERDVVASLVAKYGKPGAQTRQSDNGGGRIVWFWTATGVPVTAPRALQLCSQAISQIGVVGPGVTSSYNNAVSFTQPLVTARQHGCAFGFDAETVAARNGQAVTFKTRAVDFQAAYNAWQRTVRHVNGLKDKVDAKRSTTNRPDF